MHLAMFRRFFSTTLSSSAEGNGSLSHALENVLKFAQTANVLSSRKEALSQYDQLCLEAAQCEQLDMPTLLSSLKPVLPDGIRLAEGGKDASIPEICASIIGRTASAENLFKAALAEGSYAHVRSLYAHLVRPYQAALLKAPEFPWLKLVELAEEKDDFDGVKAFFHDMVHIGSHSLTTRALNLYLSAMLCRLEKRHDMLASKKEVGAIHKESEAQLDAILHVFDKNRLSLDQQTIRMILSHLATVGNYERLLQFLSLALSLNIRLDDSLRQYIVYHFLQEKHLTHLAMDVYESFLRQDARCGDGGLHSTTPTLHEIMLDGMISANDLTRSLAIFDNYKQCAAQEEGHHADARIALSQRLAQLCCIHENFDAALVVLSHMKNQMNYGIPSKIYLKIFTLILSSPLSSASDSAVDPFDKLQAWLSKALNTAECNMVFDEEMKQAILQLSARFLLPEGFLQFIETIDSHSK